MPCSRCKRRIPSRVLFLFLVTCCLNSSSVVVWGQSILGQAANDDSAKLDLRYKVIWNSDTGSYAYSPEKWGDLRVSLTNVRSEPREILCSTYFDQDPSLQYGRRVWLPAKSVMRISHPILIPKCDPEKGRNLSLHSLVLDVAASSEVMIRNEAGQLLHDAALIVTHGGRNTGVIGDVSIVASDPVNEIAELVSAARVEKTMTNRFSLLSDSFLPVDETVLETFDHLVIADNRIVDDFAGLSALRAWLHAGGRLWIMLDQVEPGVLKSLLGDDFAGYVADRVSLTSVRIDKTPVLSDTEILVGESVDYDDPIEMVRLVIPHVDVSYLVDGWPAAMTKSCGEGKLLITTLGARAWMHPRPPGTERNQDPQKTSNFVPNTPMSNITDEFFRVRQPDLFPRATIEPQVREYIGYSIPSWGSVVGILLGFSLCIVLLGIWLNRSHHLEHVSWIGSILAVVVSIGLLMIGRISRNSVPATLASIQFIQGMRGTDEIRTEGLLSVYQPEGSSSPTGATNGGRMIPDMTGFEGTSRRMVTTDLGAYHWENLPQPAGVRSTSFTRSESIVDRMQAVATFDSRGLHGKYSGRALVGSDAIIVTRHGRMGVNLASDGSFVGLPDDVFQPDQFLSARLLSDEQNRRRRTLQNLLTNPKRKDYPNRPQLMFWSEPWDNGFEFGEGLVRRGTSLIALPLQIERPPNGTEMVIPSPLVSYFNRRNPDGTLPSTMWDTAKKEWQERSTPGLSWLSFLVPRELLPVKIHRVRMDLTRWTGRDSRIEKRDRDESSNGHGSRRNIFDRDF